jgi:opacity protein-like surface antigen
MQKRTVSTLIIFLTTISLFLLSPVYAKRWYLSMGAGYSRNIASNQSSTVLVYSTPTLSASFFSQNTSKADGFKIQIGAGYLWPLTRHWSWSIGGRLSRQSLTQKGITTSDLFEGSYGYQYGINATTASLVSRLWYREGLWRYYGEVNTGLAALTSDGYNVDDDSGERYESQTETQVSYGVSIGVSRLISSQTTVGINLGYMNLGKASLGKRLGGDKNTGHIEQPLQMVATTFSVTHWF